MKSAESCLRIAAEARMRPRPPAEIMKTFPRVSLSLPSLMVLLSILLMGASSAQQAGSSHERARLAAELLSHHRVSCLDYHVSGNRDAATAQDNLEQTVNGGAARRSSYGRGPGGWTMLDIRMLRALVQLANEGYSFRITELAGGSHSSRSRHYVGVAFDIDKLNGKKVRYGHPSYRRFLKRCRQLGATEVFGPGTRGHSSHLHVAWPRS